MAQQNGRKKREAELLAKVAEVDVALKELGEQFRNIKKRAKGAFEGAISRKDARELEKVRKQLGLN